MRRIGFLRAGPPPAAFIEGFQQGLRELGLIEGQNCVIDLWLMRSALGTNSEIRRLFGRGVRKARR